jgi:hypothetical protein
MSKYLGLWYGGSNYAAPDGHNKRDREYFGSIAEARRTLQAREDFDPYYPCVSESAMHLYAGGEYHENGPDVVLTLGPRGGVRRDQ